ncbi:peptidase M48-like protein [Crenobacter luteus]|uniref:M48 family metallopeptidase n=1 Tax=Crenobacter luteus TaxID=1452487 RepID=UPI001051CE06|nr:M48 family metallopeptidase [Crenobacter luteus]TCP11425.1 peptidase M48-like protein [Crenobacter luteus]
MTMRTYLLAALAVAALGTGCTSSTAGGATGSNRSQLLLVSPDEVNRGAALAYAQELSKAKSAGALNRDAVQTRRVKAISNRLIAQVGVFRADARGWPWEVNVLSSPELNAYCMPGGKIAVYTGLIDKLKLTDDELAAVIGHEIAHALREHSREQISQEFVKQQGLSLALQLGKISGGTASVVDFVSQVGVSLPFSRSMETEADVMGMELMARAGYNPEAAVSVWEKMNRQSGAGDRSDFFSTHPSGNNRIANLRQNLPAVMPLYQRARAAR